MHSLPFRPQLSQESKLDQALRNAKEQTVHAKGYFIRHNYEMARELFEKGLSHISQFDVNSYSSIKEMKTELLLNIIDCSEKLEDVSTMINYCTMCIGINESNPNAYI